MARLLFENEAKVLSRLGTHDQIPRLLAHFEEDQQFYLVLVEGMTSAVKSPRQATESETEVPLQDILKF